MINEVGNDWLNDWRTDWLTDHGWYRFGNLYKYVEFTKLHAISKEIHLNVDKLIDLLVSIN